MDPSTPSMRKGRDGGNGEKKEKTDENSGHYVIASSRPPERRPLERRTLAPILLLFAPPPPFKTLSEIFVFFNYDASSNINALHLCLEPNCFAASAQNLCLLFYNLDSRLPYNTNRNKFPLKYSVSISSVGSQPCLFCLNLLM